jgi:hypothetical protein
MHQAIADPSTTMPSSPGELLPPAGEPTPVGTSDDAARAAAFCEAISGFLDDFPRCGNPAGVFDFTTGFCHYAEDSEDQSDFLFFAQRANPQFLDSDNAAMGQAALVASCPGQHERLFGN